MDTLGKNERAPLSVKMCPVVTVYQNKNFALAYLHF